MLKNINYARRDTNGISQLFVYRTDAHAATQLVQVVETDAGEEESYGFPMN